MPVRSSYVSDLLTNPRRWVKRMLELNDQVAAGITEATVANSSQTPGSYRPAVVDTIPALVGTVAALARGRRMDGSNTVERYINNSMDRAALASERTNRFFGTTNPRNTEQQYARVVGSLLIPGPKGSGAVTGMTRAERILRATGRGVAELALPLRQTRTIGGTAAVSALGTGIADTLAERFDPSYESDIYQRAEDRPVDEFEDIELAGREAAASSPEDEFAALERPLSVAEADRYEAAEQQSDWDTALGVLGTLAIGSAAVKYGPRVFSRTVDRAIEEVPTFTGKKFRRSRGGVGERATSTFVQQDQPLRNAADEFFSPQQAQDYKFDSDMINNVSIGSRVAGFFRTGRAPKTNIRTLNLGSHAEAYAKELSLDEQRTVSDALLAQSALDDFNRTGVLASLNLSRDGSVVTPAQLRAMVASARAEPRFVKYMDAVTRSYQDLLKFRVARGTLSPEMARELATQRPNYVRMSRDLETEARPETPTPYNANEHASPGYARAEDELQGVQGVTGVGNPFNSLFDDWANEIRIADVNDLRRSWLENMHQANPSLVTRVPNGVKPSTTAGLHTVQVNGVPVTYRVKDEILSNALEYSPRATNQLLETFRQVSQNMITGPLGTLMNGFAFFKSPIYDTTVGMLLKPKNIKLGLINEALSKLNPNLNIGRADPTALISAYTGAARYAWDDLRGRMAQNLSDQLIREHSWLRDIIGDQNVTALRDSLAQSYEASVKSLMDDLGISSHTMHGSPDPSKVLSGLENIAPTFTTAMAKQLARDTLEARRAGEVGPLKPLLAVSRSGFARARAATISRMYGGLLEAMHNGFRYSTVAANINRNPALKQLASQARRISVDSAQHGGSEIFNKTVGGFQYANLTVQTLHAVAQRAIKNPVQFFGNLVSVAGPLMAMHYLALASDPDAAEQHANKSAAQKASSVTTFGGAEIPVDPVMRFMIGPMMTVLDHATGANDGNWNRPFLDALASWIESDEPDDDYSQDMSDVLWADVYANNPFTLEALPFTSPILAKYGIDPGMTRVSSEATPIHTQTLSGFDADQRKTNALTTGYIENLITALTGSFGQNLISIADDAHRAYGAGAGPAETTNIALKRYLDNMAKGSAIARPILFGDYEQAYAVTDTNWEIVKEKEAGIETANQVYNRNVRGNNRTGIDPSTDVRITQDAAVPDASDTQNAYIGAAAQRLNSRLRYVNDRLQQLVRQSEGVRNGYITTAQEKTNQLNELVQQRRYYTMLKRQIIENYEATIGERIGNPDFSFDDYNPEDYMQPMTPVQ